MSALRDVRNAWLAALPLLALACQSDKADFLPARELGEKGASIPWGQSSMERFDLRKPPLKDAHDSQDSKEPPLRLAYELPSGWSELPTTASRVANFRVAGEKASECYLTLLAGDGGGLEANLNRWRSQLSQEALSTEQIASLPKSLFFGGQATLLETSGTWKGMDGSRSDPNWGLKGLVLVSQGASAFLKMTGPEKTLSAERDRFLALAASFRFEPRNLETEKPQPKSMDPAPSDSLPMANAQGLAWKAPEAWKEGPSRPMRLASWIPSEGIDVSLAALDGAGGGALANANRWRQQMGQKELSPAAFEALPRIDMLQASFPWIEIEGAGENAGKKMLGVIASTGAKTVFFKMTGPAAAVDAERERFRELVRSLRERP